MSKPINHKCQLGTEANCKLLLHMNEASWNGTPDEVKDASGCGNHGVAGGGLTTIAGGKFGRCGSFDGVNDLVDCGNKSSLNVTDTMTLEAWVKRGNNDNHAIIEKDTSYNLRFVSDQIRFWISEDGGSVNRGYLQTTNTFSSTTEWYHIVGTFDSGTFKVYVNGINEPGTLIGSAASIFVSTNNVKIGLKEAASIYFNGLIDEVAIYNRALTAEEIWQHYHAQIGMHII